jgi:hypothetical protein
MPGKPTAEKPPAGLNAYWLGVWRHALKILKDQGTWAWEQKPLLDEYVFALRGAEDARVGFKWLDHLEESVAQNEIDFIALRTIATGLPNQWDKHTKRAAALADQLALTPRGRKAVGVGEGDDTGKPEDPFGRLDEGDELASRRAKKPAGTRSA